MVCQMSYGKGAARGAKKECSVVAKQVAPGFFSLIAVSMTNAMSNRIFASSCPANGFCRYGTACGTIPLVGNAAKILAGMRSNPQDWRIEDLKIVARKYGIAHRQHGTSHVTFRFPERPLVVVPARRPIKPPYIRQFVALIDSLKVEP